MNMRVKESLCEAMRELERRGLNTGTAGNVSARVENDFYITPSGISPANLDAAGIVHLNAVGEVQDGPPTPSSEWRIHRDIYRQRDDATAVVHVHSCHATALACCRRDIPAFHYMVAIAGGDSIRCAPYACFGTQQLSDYALEALRERRACLLANHGMIALGETLTAAVNLCVEVEALAAQYWRAVQLGGVTVLTGEEMNEVKTRFTSYGRR